MKNRKCNLYITGGIAIIGIIGLVILQLRCYELIGIHGGTRFLSDLRQLGIAIMGGLFTSACVTFLISISEYKNERKEALENVCFAAEDLEREFCSFKKSVQIITDAYKRLDFLFANKSIRSHIHEKLYCRIWEEVKFIKEEGYHFDLFFKQKTKVKQPFCF